MGAELEGSPDLSTHSSLSLLLLCDYDQPMAETSRQHMDALVDRSRHRVRRLSLGRRLPERVSLDRFDGIIIHYSLVAALDSFLDAETQRRIACCRGTKALFIQDEHRHVQRTIELLRRLKIDVLFTCVPQSEVEKVYPRAELPGLRPETVLTGYVAPELCRLDVPALADRTIDVGYRARKLSAWLGQLGREKWRIGERFGADAVRYGLACDISHREEDRLYGRDWIDFMRRCRAVLGSESGSSVFDRTGEIESAVVRHELAAPDTSFEVLRDRYFRDEDGRVANGQISPRCFEAAALRTLMILYEGGYSGILLPWQHYVPLRKDHGNMAEVVAVLRDPPRAQAIVDAAYREVALNPAYSFAAHVGQVDDVMAAATGGEAPRPGYDDTEWARIARPSVGYVVQGLGRRLRLASHRLVFSGILGSLSLRRRDDIQRRLKRLLRR
jgi:glycosyl transferase family 1